VEGITVRTLPGGEETEERVAAETVEAGKVRTLPGGEVMKEGADVGGALWGMGNPWFELMNGEIGPGFTGAPPGFTTSFGGAGDVEGEREGDWVNVAGFGTGFVDAGA